MNPLRQALGRLARQAETIASKLGKPIAVEVQDSDARIAESRIRSLTSPLIHIIRNAIDHGIESPEERARSRT